LLLDTSFGRESSSGLLAMTMVPLRHAHGLLLAILNASRAQAGGKDADPRLHFKRIPILRRSRRSSLVHETVTMVARSQDRISVRIIL
jgi:hypothetical protein